MWRRPMLSCDKSSIYIRWDGTIVIEKEVDLGAGGTHTIEMDIPFEVMRALLEKAAAEGWVSPSVGRSK